MANTLNYACLSLDDYLANEELAEFKHEFVDGHVYVLADKNETHNTIAGSLYANIEINLRDGCRAWQSDMKVVGQNRSKDFAYYPDIMAACGENTGNQYIRTNPILIVEVLSPSTKRTDMTEKLDNYSSIASLLEYVIVSQDTPYVLVYCRRNHWKPVGYYAEDTLYLESVGLTIKVSDIYRRVRKEVGLDVPYPMPDNQS